MNALKRIIWRIKFYFKSRRIRYNTAVLMPDGTVFIVGSGKEQR